MFHVTTLTTDSLYIHAEQARRWDLPRPRSSRPMPYPTVYMKGLTSGVSPLSSPVIRRYYLATHDLPGKSVGVVHARGEQITAWNLLRMLQTRGEGIPLDQLARRPGVSERTLQRDLELLQELGFPVEYGEDD